MTNGVTTTAVLHQGVNAGGFHWLHGMLEHFHDVGGWSFGFGIGAASLVSAVANELKYIDERAELRELYRIEIAARLGKSPEKVNNKDMELVARGEPSRGIEANPILTEQLLKLNENRTVNFLVTLTSVLVTFGILLTLATPGSWLASGAFAAIATRGAIGFACHKLLEAPIEWTGRKIFDMEKTTPQDRIEDIVHQYEAGRGISKEQVLGVFISTNKTLGDYVKQQFGKEYDKLELPIKQSIVQNFQNADANLKNFLEGIVSNKIRITELAFAAVGQKSGLEPDDKPNVYNTNAIESSLSKIRYTAQDTFRGIKERVAKPAHHHQPTAQFRPQAQRETYIPQPAPPVHKPREVVVYEGNAHSRGGSHVADLMKRRGVTQPDLQQQSATGFSL